MTTTSSLLKLSSIKTGQRRISAKMSLLTLVVLAGTCSPTALLATQIGMPSGARSFIEVKSNVSDEVGAVGNLPLTGNLSNFPDLGSLRASGSTDADSLGGFLSAEDYTGGFGFLHVSKFDTFTLHSDVLAAGTAVNLTVLLTTEGTVTRDSMGFASAGAKIGNWNPATDPAFNEQFRVSTLATNFVQYSFSADPLSAVPVHFTTELNFTQYIGSPFDLGFQLVLSAFNTELDFSHTATISFASPAGVTVTSLDGFGAPPVAGVPDSGPALLLLAPSLFGLAVIRRRQRPAAAQVG
jgi:hypothetical protein